MEKHPVITLDGLKKKLPDVKDVTLKTYFVKMKKSITGTKERKSINKPTDNSKKKAQRGKSIKQSVLEYLNKNSDTSLEELLNVFKKEKKRTIETYFYPWQHEKAKKPVAEIQSTERIQKSSGKEKTLKAKIFTYLEENIDATPPELRENFPDENKRTLSNLHYQWRKSEKTVDKPAAKKSKKIIRPQITKKIADTVPVSTDKDLMQALQMTIVAQEKTIDAMHKTIDLLGKKEGPANEFMELAGMTIDEIKKVASTYMQGLKNLPSKFRGK